MHHLWTEALAPLYAVGDTACKDCSTEPDSSDAINTAKNLKFNTNRIYAQGKNIVVEGNFLNESHVTLVSATGQVISQKVFSQNHGQVQFENLPMGQYIAIIRGRNMVQTSTVQVK